MPQYARPEFSVCQSGVSSSIAVTTYPGERLYPTSAMWYIEGFLYDQEEA